jgi:menaquinone-9 beta-reductase
MAASYDLITVGGGLGGAALAAAMAKAGKRVLVLERETEFRDRVRGEGMFGWGVVELQALGLFDRLRKSCGHDLPYWTMYFGPQVTKRDVRDTTPQRVPMMSFFHPAMQECLLAAAREDGAEVRRGVVVTNVAPGKPPRVTVEDAGKSAELTARLVVGADGRTSSTRKWGGFTVERDPPRNFIAGALLEGTTSPSDAVSLHQGFGQLAIFFPQGKGRGRAYVAWHRDAVDRKLSGADALPRFVEASVNLGVDPSWYAGAKLVGPLATFEGADAWVPHPYANGVALVGDAAANSDPTWGQGLSLTVRDVRVLRDALLADADWDRAAHSYADQHDRHYGVVHAAENAISTLLMDVGPEADARRGKILPRIAADPTFIPDVMVSGPDVGFTVADRKRVLGEG